MKTINFGIDLGTTNSLIARYENGKLDLFRNPVGFKETLPSCVAFRGTRIIVGDKAREWITRDPLNVYTAFKRKMGTSEVFFSPVLMESLTPVQLSSYVLKELLLFLPQGARPKSVVITIPASFDTVQSNATREAGLAAGFEEVILLQEPIAASLAFFNLHSGTQKEKGNWMVYDLGGGTFDTAVVGIDDGEMRVLDHQGNNYLGGVDIDLLILKELVAPQIEKKTGISGLTQDILNRKQDCESLFHILLLKCEEAKKELSLADSAFVDVEWENESGISLDLQLEIYRADFEKLILPMIEDTIQMMDEVLVRCGKTYSEIEELILIGGSTLIPLVGKRIAEKTGLHVNNEADPTTAVAVGAAYYAGAKPSQLAEIHTPNTETPDSGFPDVKLAWNKNTRDPEEYISAEVTGIKPGWKYRFIRKDGGYDSGFREATPKFGEFVSLRNAAVNEFQLRFFDADLNLIWEYPGEISIVQGMYNLYGQPLPEDISMEVDDPDNNTTRCELLFARNSILPLEKTIYREISRHIRKNSSDALIIQLLEGDSQSHPVTNKVIGAIELNASDLASDLVKGSEVEIRISISESRDIKVHVHLGFTNEAFDEVFSSGSRSVSLAKLREDLQQIALDLQHQQEKAIANEEFEKAAQLTKDLSEASVCLEELDGLKEDDKSDSRYQLEARKRKIAGSVYLGNAQGGRTQRMLEGYYDWKETLQQWCDQVPDIPEKLRSEFQTIREKENSMFPVNTFLKAQMLHNLIAKLATQTVLDTPSLLMHFFHMYAMRGEQAYTRPDEAKKLIERGEIAAEKENFTELKSVFMQLLNLQKDDGMDDLIKGTGLR